MGTYKRAWKWLIFYGFALVFFVFTLEVVRWTITFVNWSTMDSGWAQAIGSILALFVAIFVMYRQNKHAASLLVQADLLAVRRRASAVQAIVESCAEKVEKIGETFARLKFQNAIVEQYLVPLTGSRNVTKGMIATIRAVPLHELGSYNLVDALHIIIANIEILERHLGDLIEHPANRKTDASLHSFGEIVHAINDACDNFKTGVTELS